MLHRGPRGSGPAFPGAVPAKCQDAHGRFTEVPERAADPALTWQGCVRPCFFAETFCQLFKPDSFMERVSVEPFILRGIDFFTCKEILFPHNARISWRTAVFYVQDNKDFKAKNTQKTSVRVSSSSGKVRCDGGSAGRRRTSREVPGGQRARTCARVHVCVWPLP